MRKVVRTRSADVLTKLVSHDTLARHLRFLRCRSVQLAENPQWVPAEGGEHVGFISLVTMAWQAGQCERAVPHWRSQASIEHKIRGREWLYLLQCVVF